MSKIKRAPALYTPLGFTRDKDGKLVENKPTGTYYRVIVFDSEEGEPKIVMPKNGKLPKDESNVELLFSTLLRAEMVADTMVEKNVSAVVVKDELKNGETVTRTMVKIFRPSDLSE